MAITLTSVTPANGGTYSIARPPIVFQINSDENRYPAFVEYWISTSATPETDPSAYYGSQSITINSGGFPANINVTLELPTGVTLTPGVWNIHATVKQGPQGAGILLGERSQSFTIAFIPAATPLTPSSGEARQFVNTTSNLLVTWAFSGDTQNNDTQSAYQVIVNRVSDNAVVVDTGKVVTAEKQAVVTIPQAYADTELSWRVRVWNKWDSPSNYSSANTFTLRLTFSLDITLPANNQVLSTGNPDLTVALTISGGATVQAINASAWKNDVKVWDKTVYGNWATGASVNITDSVSVFASTSYTYRVTAQSSGGSWSNAATRNFSVSYTLPPTPSGAPTVSLDDYQILGYTRVTFADSSRDTDFYCWALERRDDLIDPNTNVTVLTGDWVEVGRVYDIAANYTFDDYLAPSNYKVTYRVVQVALKYGYEIRSVASSSSATVTPTSDAYWLYAGLNGDPASVAIKLHNVTADSFNTEYETAQYTLMGAGRYSERGARLGVVGTLNCQLRNSDGTPARLKRLLLEDFIDVFPVAQMRGPFGDTYMVALGSVAVERIAGTGKSEFTNVSIPYSEVVS